MPNDLLAFVDKAVGEGDAPSRAAFVVRALERERRRLLAEQDVKILQASAGEPDEFSEMTEYASWIPLDLD